jgi:hypothetical protein
MGSVIKPIGWYFLSIQNLERADQDIDVMSLCNGIFHDVHSILPYLNSTDSITTAAGKRTAIAFTVRLTVLYMF